MTLQPGTSADKLRTAHAQIEICTSVVHPQYIHTLQSLHVHVHAEKFKFVFSSGSGFWPDFMHELRASYLDNLLPTRTIPHCTGICPKEWFNWVVVVLVGNSWAVFLSCGELSPVGWCPTTLCMLIHCIHNIKCKSNFL